MKGNLFKIREGKLETWRAWCKTLSTKLREEALLTMEDEYISQELFIIFEIDKTFYTIGLIEGDNIKASDNELNLNHQMISRECLAKIGPIELGYFLKFIH